MPLIGSQVSDPNYILRFSVIMVLGMVAFASLLGWRSALFMASEYQEMPITHEQMKIKKENTQRQTKMQTDFQKKIQQKYQIE